MTWLPKFAHVRLDPFQTCHRSTLRQLSRNKYQYQRYGPAGPKTIAYGWNQYKTMSQGWNLGQNV